MIEIKSLQYEISGKQILKDIDALFEPGKLNVILGPNGSGKSTLLKLISGILKSENGEINYHSKPISAIKTEEFAKYRAVLSQNIEVVFDITVKEMVTMGRYPHFHLSPTRIDKEIINQSLEKFGLIDFQYRNYRTLSGGEQQRVQFARIYAQIWDETQQAILLLDEPLSFLDISFQYEFMELISEMKKRKNITIIGVLHDLNLAAKYADVIFLLKRGKLKFQGTVAEVLHENNILNVFGIKPEISIIDQKVRIYF